MFKTIIGLAAASLLATPALAQDVSETTSESHSGGSNDATGFIAVGPGMTPKYDGSSDYQLIPLVIGNLEWKGVEIQVRGLGARADILGDSRIQAGPAFNLRMKRDSARDGKDGVQFLHNVGTSIEVGGFIGYRLGGDEKGQGAVTFNLTALGDVNGGHGGFLATGQVSYAALRSRKIFVDVDAQTTYGDGKYTRAYFGVTPQEAAVSGLAAFTPGGGLRDVGAGVTAGYQFNKRWGVIARAGGNYYVGDAKNSPVVDKGSKFQGIAGLAVSYRF